LNASYTRPNGSKSSFGGFYDEAITEDSFMPDQVGISELSCNFTDGNRISGKFEPPSTNPVVCSQRMNKPQVVRIIKEEHELIL